MRKSNEIYLVGTIQKDLSDCDCRAVGWFSTTEQAKKCIEENHGDIYENGYYPFALIEKVCEGLYSHNEEIQWYSWIKDCYVECDKPSELSYSIRFTMG